MDRDHGPRAARFPWSIRNDRETELSLLVPRAPPPKVWPKTIIRGNCDGERRVFGNKASQWMPHPSPAVTLRREDQQAAGILWDGRKVREGIVPNMRKGVVW